MNNLFDGHSPPLQQRLDRLRDRPILVMLAAWLGFAVLVYCFVTPLNRIVVPVLNMPLGMFIAAQGALIVFVALLFHFARKHGAIRNDEGEGP